MYSSVHSMGFTLYVNSFCCSYYFLYSISVWMEIFVIWVQSVLEFYCLCLFSFDTLGLLDLINPQLWKVLINNLSIVSSLNFFLFFWELVIYFIVPPWIYPTVLWYAIEFLFRKISSFYFPMFSSSSWNFLIFCLASVILLFRAPINIFISTTMFFISTLLSRLFLFQFLYFLALCWWLCYYFFD